MTGEITSDQDAPTSEQRLFSDKLGYVTRLSIELKYVPTHPNPQCVLLCITRPAAWPCIQDTLVHLGKDQQPHWLNGQSNADEPMRGTPFHLQASAHCESQLQPRA